ncbi:cytosine methyltransferase, partial [mine drainage metagenome]
GIPWRVALALQADGWYLRSDIIWHKPNPMPESVTDRPTKAHEYLFLLAKSERYYYDAEAIREPDSGQDHPRNVLDLREPTVGLMAPHRGI